MIVPSMNARELVKEIMLDTPMVETKAEYLIEAHRREAVKSKDKNYYHLFDYHSKRQNNWLISINYSKGIPTFNIIVYYSTEYGLNAISVGEQSRLYQFTAHFLKRYNERFLKQFYLTKLDLLKRFISVNKAAITEVDDINQCIFVRFSEGIALGDVEIITYPIKIYHLRTFISDPMAHHDQQHSIEMASEYYELYGKELKKRTGIKGI